MPRLPEPEPTNQLLLLLYNTAMASLVKHCLKVLAYSLAFSKSVPRGVYGNATLEEASSPPSSNANENLNPALLSSSNVLSAIRVAWNITAFSLSYLIHIPKLVYLPIKHATAIFVYVIEVLLRPVYPILAPVYLALRILLTPIIVPVLLLYRVAVLVYPLYVFLGAAVLCGIMAGLVARRLGGAIVKDVFRFRSQLVPVSSKVRGDGTRKKRA